MRSSYHSLICCDTRSLLLRSNRDPRHCDEYVCVCLSVLSASISLKSDATLSESLCVCAYFASPMRGHSVYTWRHPQNRNYITYRNATRAESRHGGRTYTFAHNRLASGTRTEHIHNVTHQGQHRSRRLCDCLVSMSCEYTQGEVTSQNLWSRYDRHFVGITWHNVRN